MKHYVYRLFDTEGDLLYVGVSKNPHSRFRGHQRRAPWARRVRRGRISVYPTLDAALAAERDVIRAERPRFNVVHNRGPETTPVAAAPSPRCWYVVRAYDLDGRLLKIGQTRSLRTWWHNQRSYSSPWMPRAARLRVSGPYERPTMLRLVREARATESVAS